MKLSIVTKIILIFIIFGIIPMLTFSYLYTVIENHNNDEVLEESLNKLVIEKSNVLLLTLGEVESEIENLGEWIEHYINNTTPDDLRSFENKNGLTYDSVGLLKDSKKLTEIMQSAENTDLYLAHIDHITKIDIEEMVMFKKINTSLINTKSRLAEMGWIYFISESDHMLITPKTDVKNFGYNHDFADDIYYIIAAPDNNPTREAVWTEPYYDWLDKGWTITCSLPVYAYDKFIGVVSIDVLLDKISSTVADFSFLESGYAFLIDRKGNVVYHPDVIGTNKDRGDSLSMNLLSKSRGAKYEEILHEMIKGENGFNVYRDESTDKLNAIVYTYIEELNWSLGIDVDWRSYQDVAGITQDYVLTVIVPLIVLFMIIGIFLFRTISKPLKKLSLQAECIAKGDYSSRIESKSNDEIGVLEHAFKQMSESIGEYTQDLLEKNREIEAVFKSFPGLLYIITNEYELRLMNKKGIEQLTEEKKANLKPGKNICYEELFSRNTPCIGCPINHKNAMNGEISVEVSRNNKLFRIRSYPIFNDENEIKEWVLFSNEITHEFVMEKMVLQAEKMAGVGQTVAGVTHELRNPITVIKGANRLIKDIFTSDMDLYNNGREIVSLLDQIDDSIKHSENIIYNLLDFSRQATRPKEMIDINRIIHQVLILEGQQLLKNQVNVKCEFDNEKQWIWCNRDSLKHIFLNLISNAIQAMPNEDAELTLQVKELEENYVEVKIGDNGSGIPKWMENKIFEPFFSTKEEQGVGLGLWLTKMELEKVGAEITLKSNLDIGTVFTMKFLCGETTE